jgi:phage FluMu protein Com
MTASARHETRALLRAHLAAASSYGHLTRHCPICRHLLRLAMESTPYTPPAAHPAEDEVTEDESPAPA